MPASPPNPTGNAARTRIPLPADAPWDAIVAALPAERRMSAFFDGAGDGGPILDVPSDLAAAVQAMLADAPAMAATALALARAASVAAVDAERDRRIAAGIVFAGVRYQTDFESRARVDKARSSAMAAVLGGAQAGDLRWHGLEVDFFWIAEDNSRIPMDAPTTIAFGSALAAREGLIIVAASDLKARIATGETIADVGADALWPGTAP